MSVGAAHSVVVEDCESGMKEGVTYFVLFIMASKLCRCLRYRYGDVVFGCWFAF